MKYEPVATVSERIREAMNMCGMRQVELVEKTGLSKGLVNHYVSGRVVNAKTDKIYLLAKALGVDETWLMGYDVPMKKEQDYSALENVDTNKLAELLVGMESSQYLNKLLELSEPNREMIFSMIDRLYELEKGTDKP